ncbi:MAG: DEAD/DEAH box helicase [Elusimicrobiota bacterium]
MKSFDELKLSQPLARAIHEMGYTAPTPIQQQALPILLGGPTDFIGQAGTGTGKTAAFGLPLLELVDPHSRRVQGLVLCPTRELALQVTGQINLMGKHKGVRALPVYGGTGYGDQLEGLKQGVQIVVGTPGRLIDHIDRRAVTLDGLKVVVLDEADEMISMGFREDLEKILSSVPREKSHIWLFSATMSGDVRRVADTYLRHPKQVRVNQTEMLSNTVEQIVYTVRESDKPEILCKIVEAADDFYGLVFCQTKALVAELAEYLQGRGLKVDCLHGDKSQDDRERTMRAFREKKVTLLICTDVASRGLDVKELTHVINYSVPRELDIYVHRIGRTARSGKPGTAISFMIPTHRHLISRLEHWTKSKMKEGKIPTRKDIAAKKVLKLLERFQEQKNFARAAELLGPDWKAATAGMSPDEVIGRFIAMTAPELFEERPKEKPFVQAHVPRPAHPHGAGGRPAHKGPKGPWKTTHGKPNRGQG